MVYFFVSICGVNDAPGGLQYNNLHSGIGVHTWEQKQTKARSIAPGLYVKFGADYGSLCGVPTSVLNEQLTCGLLPTVVVVYVPPAGQLGTLLAEFSLM